MMTKNTTQIGLIQLSSGPALEKNLQKIAFFLKKAVDQGCEWVFLPEVCLSRKQGPKDILQPITLGDETWKTLSEWAALYKVWLFVGSVCEKQPDDTKLYNTSLVFNPDGKQVGLYRKMHLFEVDLPNSKIKESEIFNAGKKPEYVQVGSHQIGLSICYDLRFPELYRYYSRHGCQVLSIPASFTTPTGIAHWEVLCRARAIENQCFVVATNQTGFGAGGVATYGHSMVVDPWGNVLVCGSEHDEELLVVTLDFDHPKQIRAQLPALNHRTLL